MLKHNYIKDKIRWHAPKHRITLNVTTALCCLGHSNIMTDQPCDFEIGD